MAKADTKTKADADAKVKSNADTKTKADADAKGEDAAQTEGKTIAPPERLPGDVPPHGENEVVLRSRYRLYEWGGVSPSVKFDNYTAVVSRDVAERASRDPLFGPGRDFWRDTAAA
ncbi:MAG: hypothetical protein KJZ65_06690 [Phycisphaerales bacterium]|nr:hypothetical protein [Phycisphaerales bacterium]